MKATIGAGILLTSEESKMKKFKNIAIFMMAIFIANSVITDAAPVPLNIKNVAPTVSLSVTPGKKPVDIVILTDYTGSKLSALDTQISELKARFNAVNVDPDFHIVSDVKKIGTQTDVLYKYRRYGTFTRTVNKYTRYQNHGVAEEYEPYTETYTELWEEAEGLLCHPESLPVREPQNITFTQSALIKYESSNGSIDRHYYEYTIKCTNDVKSKSAAFEFEKWYRSSSSGAERVYGNTVSQEAKIDKNWKREEKISNVNYDVFSLNFDRLSTIPLRPGADRHLIFLSDAASKDYSQSLGNYFSFGDMTDTLKNYITANGFSIYGVVPEELKNMTFLPPKVSSILPLGDTTLFDMKDGSVLKLGNKSLASSLPSGTKMSPEPAASAGAVKDKVIVLDNVYLLMEDGTIKYFDSTAWQFKKLSGISGIIKLYVFDGDMYALNSSGKVFLIDGGSLAITPFNNGVAIDCIARAQAENIYITKDGLPYVEYRTYDKVYDKYKDHLLARLQIKNWDTDVIKDMPAIKDAAYFAAPAPRNGMEPMLFLYSTGEIKQFRYIEYETIETLKTETYIKYWREEPAYSINETDVDAIEGNDICIFIFKNDGKVKMLNTDWESASYEDRDGDVHNYQKPILRKTTRTVPLTNIVKTFKTGLYRFFFTDNNNQTYMYDGAARAPLPVIGTTLKSMGSSVAKLFVYAPFDNNENDYVYVLYNDGTVRQIEYNYSSYNQVSDTILPHTGIKDIFISAENIYFLDESGYVVGKGDSEFGQIGSKTGSVSTFSNPFTSTISLNAMKSYLSLFDIFQDMAESEFFPVGQYADAFNSIYRNYENNSSIGTAYVLLGEDLEYHSTYNDFESDPEHSRRYTITHDANYFDNSIGISKYHNPSGYIGDPPARLDKVGKYVIDLKVRDNPKDDNLFDNYRLWSLGNHNLSVYVHRRPIALQRITVDNNSNGTYTVKAYDAGSYDLDHNISRADKGIVAREWRWKDSSQINWHYEQISKADCSPDKGYTLQLRVQDAEGAWSSYNTIEIADDPPVALFDIDKNPIFANEKLLVKDKSYPRSFFPIDRWHWIVKKYNKDGTLPVNTIQNAQFGTSNNGTEGMEGYDVNVKTDYADAGEGSYRVYLRVRDSRGLWSDGGTNSTYNIDSFY
ncbi:MAG TPA: hypothetical protein VD757_00920, partial [Candidatus Nitrosocosmicus sp.]|nr:hypothetical protein [Candidatus Nitrosocosmicus sp.]